MRGVCVVSLTLIYTDQRIVAVYPLSQRLLFCDHLFNTLLFSPFSARISWHVPLPRSPCPASPAEWSNTERTDRHTVCGTSVCV